MHLHQTCPGNQGMSFWSDHSMRARPQAAGKVLCDQRKARGPERRDRHTVQMKGAEGDHLHSRPSESMHTRAGAFILVLGSSVFRLWVWFSSSWIQVEGAKNDRHN